MKRVLKYGALIIFSSIFGWYLGQIVAMCFIWLLKYTGTEELFFKFMDTVTI